MVRICIDVHGVGAWSCGQGRGYYRVYGVYRVITMEEKAPEACPEGKDFCESCNSGSSALQLA